MYVHEHIGARFVESCKSGLKASREELRLNFSDEFTWDADKILFYSWLMIETVVKSKHYRFLGLIYITNLVKKMLKA
jgi:hypothetical protein